MWKHIAGWVNVTSPDGPEGPVDPGYGRPGWAPVDPGYGNRPPVDPGYGRPDIGGGRPDNELPGGGGYVWGTLVKLVKWILGPHVDVKPPGAPILPVDPGWGNRPPDGTHPWLPGHWLPVDPGFGKPPIWGWAPVDPGFGVGGGGGGTLPAGPGHWVPVDPEYGVPDRERRCGGEHPWGQPPLWVWIAEIGPDFGKPKPTPPIAPGASPK